MVFEWEAATRLAEGRGTRAVYLQASGEGCPPPRLSKGTPQGRPPSKKHALRRRPVAAQLSSTRTDRDAFSAKDKTCRRLFRRGVRARAELKNTCSEQTDISPAAKRRGPRRRRRAVQTTPQRRLPRGERRRRPPARVRRRKKATAAGAVEPRLGPANSGREAALR